MVEEKRKHKRYKAKEGAFAAFIRSDDSLDLGNLLDISMGGLCVRYLSTSETQRACNAIKIFGSNGRFIHLDKVVCRVVYDQEIPERSWNRLKTRRCGVEFESLNVRQTAMLQDFIDNFAHAGSEEDPTTA
jgi:hypothetical protein